MALERINAYQGELTRTLKWPPHSQEVRGLPLPALFFFASLQQLQCALVPAS